MKGTWALKEVTSTGNEVNFVGSVAFLHGKIMDVAAI
jgi:hypothetical protein